MAKVILGMSGGIDSSVTAYLMKRQGFEVAGVSMIMCEEENAQELPACCSTGAIGEAARNAHHLGVKHTIIDVREEFSTKVTKPFVSSYLAGLTPNPCVLCNRFIKFPTLKREADRQGAEYIATGHYARLRPQGINGNQSAQRSDGSRLHDAFLLEKGVDRKKDQSYVLYILKQEELGKLLLPLGGYRKEEVRKIAREINLPGAERNESQEICFVENKQYIPFIEKHAHVARNPGPVRDLQGNVIGTHKGIYGYTIGQRKGLGIASPFPLYVIQIDVRNNTIYAGPRDAAASREFLVSNLNWIIDPLHIRSMEEGLRNGFMSSEKTVNAMFRASVKVRSTMKEQPAVIHIADIDAHGTVRVVFDEPQWAPAPGQSAVFYHGDIVIGGGVII